MKYVFLRLLIFAVVSKIHGVATDFMDTLYIQAIKLSDPSRHR